MARVVLTPQLDRFMSTCEVETPARTLQEALEASFAANPEARPYVLDEQGHLRKHIAVFVDGEMIRNRSKLTVALAPSSEVFILQALSGG